MSDCLFCKILNQEIPSDKVFENDLVYGFKDINPMSKDHFLFISKEHTRDISELINNESESLVDIFKAIDTFTKSNGLKENGYRVVNNLGKDGGQTVFHTHFHVLGGEKLKSFGA
jgi:histidine triad (HIT) family protein